MNRKELNEILQYEKNIYIKSVRAGFLLQLCKDERWYFYKYLKMLRLEEYFLDKRGIYARAQVIFFRMRRNNIGNKMDIKIVPNFAGPGVNIHHKGVIINGRVGRNCIFHGRNTIGNNTMGQNGGDNVPQIGNGVEFGIGSVVIGNVRIADGVKIGANAVVVKSVCEEKSVVAGIPAKQIR